MNVSGLSLYAFIFPELPVVCVCQEEEAKNMVKNVQDQTNFASAAATSCGGIIYLASQAPVNPEVVRMILIICVWW